MLRALLVFAVAGGAANAVAIGQLPALPIHFSLFDDPPERLRIFDDLGKIPFIGGLATKLIPTPTRAAEKPESTLLETGKELANKAVITADPVLHTAVYPVVVSALSANRFGIPDIKMNVPLFECSIIEKLSAAGQELCSFGNQITPSHGKLENIPAKTTVDVAQLDNVETSSDANEFSPVRRPVRSPSFFSGVAEETGAFSGFDMLAGKPTVNRNLNTETQMEQDSEIFGDFPIKLLPATERQLNTFGKPLEQTGGVLAKSKATAAGTFGALAGEVLPTADRRLDTIGNQIGLTGGEVVKAKANAADNLTNFAGVVVPSAKREFDNIGNQVGLAGGMVVKEKAEILGGLGSLTGEVLTTAQRQSDNIGSQVGKTGAVLVKEKALAYWALSPVMFTPCLELLKRNNRNTS